MHLMWRSENVASVHTLYIEKSVMGMRRLEGFPIQVSVPLNLCSVLHSLMLVGSPFSRIVK